MKGRVLVSGASGPIGTAVLAALAGRKYEVVRLVRKSASGANQILWDPLKPLAAQSVSGFNAVIHLAGESIVGRWTPAKKNAIRDSRVLGTRHLAEALGSSGQPPDVFISASAIGYYGNRADEILREESSSGPGFLAEVCRQWEAETETASKAGIRCAQIRIGLVLSPHGGALSKMLLPFKMGLGGKIGTGQQWWSWIDVTDIVGAILHIMETEPLHGPVNLVAPYPVTNEEFTKTLASVLSRPALFAVPEFLVRLALGQTAEELLLASQRVEPAKLLGSGYSFKQPDLKQSLEAILHS